MESALLYLELSTSVSLGEVVQPLIVAAKEYLVARYSDFDKSKKEAMDLPLCAIEVVLGSAGLQVDLEDDVFDFILEWACVHYPQLKQRREILTKRLVQCICFPYMSASKLKEVLVCPDFGHEEISKLVFEALFLKAEVPYLRQIHGSKDLATTNLNSLGRIYKHRPIKVVQFEFSEPRGVVYFDLKKEECENLFQSTRLRSQSFCLDGRRFHLMARCIKGEQNSFGLFLHMTKESESCMLEYEYAVIKKSSKRFHIEKEDKVNYWNLSLSWGYQNLFEIPWTDFMSKDSEYFIDGILHLRADVTIKNAQA